ncbi:hypothetical protein RAS1_07510 [Phycisphaerae bacterium RAS1]|nr:hypothetical protein RAS1_07510 [Phycisphaerae bacterium RAS1]
MSNFNVDPGNGQPPVKITQNAGDIKAGYQQDDLTRISAYTEKGKGDGGLHTGANSPTVGRHNKEFNPKS